MTRHSSIFSFETLRLRPWVPKAAIAAALLLLCAEMAARHAVKTKRLHVDASGRQLIDDHRKAIEHNEGDIWLLGNSTLGYGIDEKLLARRTGDHILKLPHGSATVGASAKLLDYYLDIAKSHPPREVVVFVTKDDLNLHGYRALVSAEYENLTHRPMRKPQEFLMLWQARSHIADRCEEIFQHVLHHGKKATVPVKEPNFDGKIAPDDEMYTRLIKDFEMDPAAISNIAAAAHRHGVKNVALVLVPCTDVYARFHDNLVPRQPYAKLRADIAAQCASAGIAYYDFGDPSTAYAEFYDGYHLNNDGAARFTARLVDNHVLLPPVGGPIPTTTVDSAQPNAPVHADAGVAD